MNRNKTVLKAKMQPQMKRSDFNVVGGKNSRPVRSSGGERRNDPGAQI